MKHPGRLKRIAITCTSVLLVASSARAQVASLGKGWLLGPVGSMTSVSGEVISGRSSIKGSGDSQAFLITDPSVIPFAPNQSYTITFAYRIITSTPAGFGYSFNSSTGIGISDQAARSSDRQDRRGPCRTPSPCTTGRTIR